MGIMPSCILLFWKSCCQMLLYAMFGDGLQLSRGLSARARTTPECGYLRTPHEDGQEIPAHRVQEHFQLAMYSRWLPYDATQFSGAPVTTKTPAVE